MYIGKDAGDRPADDVLIEAIKKIASAK
jgi:hypothetical protein